MTEPDADDTEAAWRDIVDNYGERAFVDPEEYGEAGSVRGFTPATAEPEQPAEPDELEDLDELEDDFVPPPAPPLPHPSPDRLVAWLGVLGAPTVVLVLLLSGLSIPSLLGWVLVAAFVGGFGYLVAQMPREPRDPWDDGSRV